MQRIMVGIFYWVMGKRQRGMWYNLPQLSQMKNHL